MDHLETDIASSTHQLVSAQRKLAIEHILKQVSKISALLDERNDLGSTGNSELSGFRQDEMRVISFRIRNNKLVLCKMWRPFLCLKPVKSA